MKKIGVALLAFFISAGFALANETPSPASPGSKSKTTKKESVAPGIPTDNINLFKKMQTQINTATIALDQRDKNAQDKKSELERLLVKQKSLLSKFKESTLGINCPERVKGKIAETSLEMQNIVKRLESGLTDNLTQLKQKRIISLLNEMNTK